MAIKPDTAVIKKDRFATDDQYLNSDARKPRIQALRGENGKEDCGYFITEQDLTACGWQSYQLSETHTYQFNSGKTEKGLLFKAPRMLVVPRTPLLVFDRNLSNEQKRTVIIGQYDAYYHGDRTIYGLMCNYDVLLLDNRNQFLHTIPLSYTAKGANQASFSINWSKFIQECTAVHADINDIPNRPKNRVFSSMCVYSFKTDREIVGTKLKSASCKVTGYQTPTANNFHDLFLGADDEMADDIIRIMDPSRPLEIPANKAVAQTNNQDHDFDDTVSFQ